MFRLSKFLTFLSLFSIILLALIAVDFSPFLRGPAPYPPDWRWPYVLTNNFSKIWAPLLIISLILLIYRKAELNLTVNKASYLLALIFLGFLLQISLLYFSRSGIEVIVHRMINPMISGYFSVSTQIIGLGNFLVSFNQNIYDYPMYARFHPPGGILFFYFLEYILRPFSSFFTSILNTSPSHSDVAIVWNSLSISQKFNALGSGFVIAFISSLSIVPIYFASKISHDEKTAIRASVLFLFVPSVLLFVPLIDVIMPIFTSLSLYLFLKGTKSKNHLSFFISGLILFMGSFFTLTFLPFLLFFFLVLLIRILQGKDSPLISVKNFLSFILGFIFFLFVLFFAGFNFLENIQRIMIFHEAAQAGREHLTWYFYNLYDFMLFAGIPIGLVLIYLIFKSFESVKKDFKKIDHVFLSFLITLLIINFSGTVRAETARIWLPFIPILIIVVANFVTNKLKFTRQQFSLLLLLQAIQVLIFQSVLVMVW